MAATRRPTSALVLLTLWLGGCVASLAPAPDLGGIYDRAASSHGTARNPIIVIPGVLGSVLTDSESQRPVWGSFLGTHADPRRKDGARLIALPMREGAPLSDLRDAVVPDGVLESVRVRLLGLPVEQQAYIYLLRTLGVGGYRDQQLGEAGAIDYGSDHYTCFQFAYDWRRDSIENARLLHEFMLAKRAFVIEEHRRRTGETLDEVRFDVVAHSMGGLLLRYYLRYGTAEPPAEDVLPRPTWAGAALVEKAILIATPNAGSLQSLRDLVEGSQIAFVLPRYPPAVVGTMPAIYQLLPRMRHGALTEGDRPLDVLDAATWERLGWGLAAPDQDEVLAQLLPDVPEAAARRRIALDHQRKSLARARAFHRALDAPSRPPPGTTLHLYAGDAEPTEAVSSIEDGALRAARTQPGDGTVLRTSAVMDERVGRADWRPGLDSPVAWDSVTFVFSDHLQMTRDPSFTDNLLYRLLEAPRP